MIYLQDSYDIILCWCILYTWVPYPWHFLHKSSKPAFYNWVSYTWMRLILGASHMHKNIVKGKTKTAKSHDFICSLEKHRWPEGYLLDCQDWLRPALEVCSLVLLRQELSAVLLYPWPTDYSHPNNKESGFLKRNSIYSDKARSLNS